MSGSKEVRAGSGRLSKISKGNMNVMVMATNNSKIKPTGRLLILASLEEIDKACGDCRVRISDDSWELGIWLDGYSDGNPPDAILYNDGHLAVLQGLDHATVRTEIERRLCANLPAIGAA
jgi:hypothetical protein